MMMRIYGLKWHCEGSRFDSGDLWAEMNESGSDAVDLVVWGLQSKTGNEPISSGCLLQVDFLNSSENIMSVNVNLKMN
jgi:hypothetical protein